MGTTWRDTFYSFKKKLLIIGCGSIGQAVLPLILRHIRMDPHNITILTADVGGQQVADSYGIKFIVTPVTRENYQTLIPRFVGAGDMILNLSVDVSSRDMILLARELGALYVDTVVEPWSGVGGYTDPNLSMSQRSNYALRYDLLRHRLHGTDSPTAVSTCGANPGIVSWFVKCALLRIADALEMSISPPHSPMQWGLLAESLGIQVIHIAEQDTQMASMPKETGVFTNTWSVNGFLSEGAQQPAEAGWGTHEPHLPRGWSNHLFGDRCGIFGPKCGMETPVQSWTPLGPHTGFLVTHNEPLSIRSHLEVREEGKLRYAPTVHYAYLPCPAAVISIRELQRGVSLPGREYVYTPEDIVRGADYLGVLLMGPKMPQGMSGYWYGSTLSIDQAKALAPHNTATSLQVAIGALVAMVYAMKYPRLGIIEADEMDHEFCMKLAERYLGMMVGEWTDWRPLQSVPGHPFAIENFLVHT